jgi:CD109 antigen
MKKRCLSAISLILTLLILLPALPACRKVYSVTSYMAIIPKVLQSGLTQQLSVALLNGSNLAGGDVNVTLSKDGKTVASAKEYIYGQDIVDLKVPQLASGDYEIRVSGSGFDKKSTVKVESSSLIFLETDKPIYKPGQTIHISAFSLS